MTKIRSKGPQTVHCMVTGGTPGRCGRFKSFTPPTETSFKTKVYHKEVIETGHGQHLPLASPSDNKVKIAVYTAFEGWTTVWNSDKVGRPINQGQSLTLVFDQGGGSYVKVGDDVAASGAAPNAGSDDGAEEAATVKG